MRLCAIASSSWTLTLLLFSSSMFFCVCSSILAISRCFSEVSLPFSAPLLPALTTRRLRGVATCTGHAVKGLLPSRAELLGWAAIKLLLQC